MFAGGEPPALGMRHRNDNHDKGYLMQVHRTTTRGVAAALLTTAVGAAALVSPLSSARADDSPPISIGAGVRTSFDVTDPSGGKTVNDFNLDSIRLYVNGTVTEHIKFMFNTEYEGSPPAGNNSVQVLDAVGRFEFSDYLNVWAGRFLPPSDRANLYGPYYSNQWSVYKDGVQDGYPSTAVGRDNGLAYWGQFGMLKLSAGVFDVPGTTGSSKELYAARAQVDLWDPEGGYYLNGTYYGDKDLLAIGLAGQSSDTDHAYSADFLLEKKLPNLGVISVESEYAKYDHLGGYAADKSDGYYGLVSYLFPQVIGVGKFQLLGKYAHAKYRFDTSPIDDAQKTYNVEINYIIKQFNARLSLYYLDIKYDNDIVGRDNKQYGIGVQLQM